MNSALLIYQMLDDLAKEFAYPNGIQDLVLEEAAVNVEMLQTVYERLEEQLKLYEEEVGRAYQ